MGRFLSLAALSVILIGGVLFLGSKFAFAEEPDNNASLQVSPVIEELSIKPASETDRSISVSNHSEDELKIRVYVTPYSYAPENEASDFESQTEYTQIDHWIRIQGSDSKYHEETEFTIGPHKTTTINYRVEVPESAPGGSQHACIFVETIPDDTEEFSGVVTASRAAVKVFANVAGETVQDAEIIGLDVNTFTLGGKVSATTRVKNIGNIDIKPTLTLKIDSLSGETIYNNTAVAMVFPENESEIIVSWPETPFFGIYNMTASVNILGKNSTIRKLIFVMPVWFVILPFAMVVAIVFAIYYFKKSRETSSRLDTKR